MRRPWSHSKNKRLFSSRAFRHFLWIAAHSRNIPLHALEHKWKAVFPLLTRPSSFSRRFFLSPNKKSFLLPQPNLR
jgi:hypothetical protein